MRHLDRALGIVVLIVGTIAAGLAADAGEIVVFQAGATEVVWRPTVPFEYGVVTIADPDGKVFHEEFRTGAGAAFRPFGQPGYRPPDGTYIWEVRLGQPSRVDSQLRAAARAARESGDADVEAAHRRAAARATQVQSGAFQIVKGAIVPSTLVEPGATRGLRRPRGGAPDPFRLSEWILDDPSIRPVDQVIADDLIVQGSACIGLDCVNNESFGFDTIRMKENNTRIKFDDTSTSAGFPDHDWQLTANDSASGGANKFSIEDVTAGTVPFTVLGGAPSNALFVDGTGRVGLHTATPVLELHLNTGDTPATRLEQNNTGGFTAQTWDIAGNEANFFVRDVTGGSRLPFRIRPGAPTSSIDIAASGKVGVGTASPAEKLHVDENVNANTFILVRNQNTGTSTAAVLRAQSDVATVNFQTHASTRTISRFGQTLGGWAEQLQVAGNGLIVGTLGATPLVLGTNSANRIHITGGGNVGVGTTTPTNPLQMASGAFVSAAGVWTNASSRTLKQDIEALTASEAQAALERLAPVRYASRVDPTERHVGFIAEDVPELVATRDRKSLSPMDIVAVLTRVVQEQQKTVQEQRRTVEAQQRTIAELAAKIEAIEAGRPAGRFRTGR